MTVVDTLTHAWTQVHKRFLREQMPRTWAVYNDVPARDGRLGDPRKHYPDYKHELKHAIEEFVDEGDDVVLVGAGRGVSSVWCARQVAHVAAYEAALEMVDIARQTVSIQGYDDRVTVGHCVVGEPGELFGSLAGASSVLPTRLPPHDVLVMDCEGAEVGIIDGLEEAPAACLVETHPEHGVDVDATAKALADLGMLVERRDIDSLPDKELLVGVATHGGKSW